MAIIQTGDTSILFRAALFDATNAKITAGSATMRLWHIVPTTGAIESYDFNDDTFKTTALTTPTLALTHRTTDNSTYNTGTWTVRHATLTAFTIGDKYIAEISHASLPHSLQMEFQYGGAEGDTALEATVQAIQTLGATLNQFAGARTLTKGSEVGVFGNTENDDASYHEINDAAGTTDVYYDFDIGPANTPSGVTWKGYGRGTNDDWDVMAYDWGGAGWDTIGNIQGLGPGVPPDWVQQFILFPKHVDTSVGATEGVVRIRFYNTGLTTSELQTNQLTVQYAVSATAAASAGYSNGAIWVDTVSGVAGTTAHFNGTADNPVLTWADALTLSTALGIKNFRIANGSTIQLSANSDNYTMSGDNWTLDLNGQSIVGFHAVGATVSGTCTGSGYDFHDCIIGNVTAADGDLRNCGIAGDFVLSAAGTYYFDQCYSGVDGTAIPSVDFGAGVANTNLNMRHYSGGIEVKNIGQNGTDNMNLEGHGQIVLNANCAGGTIAIRGHFTITDNVAGGFVVAGGVLSDDARYTMSEQAIASADDVWDEDIVAAHGTASTAGLLLRALGAAISARANNSTLDDLLGVPDTAATDTVTGQVWEEVMASHNTAASMGAVMNAIAASGYPTVASIADGVWDEDIVAAHGTADTGGLLLRALGALISQRANNPNLNALLGVPDTALYDIAYTIWDEDVTAHVAASSAGAALDALGTAIDGRANNANLNALLAVPDVAANTIANPIWDALTASHAVANSAGQRLQALDLLLESGGAGDAAVILAQALKLDQAALLAVGDPGYDADSVAGDLNSLITTVATIDRDILCSVNLEGSDLRIEVASEQYGLVVTGTYTQCSCQIFAEDNSIVATIGVGDFGAITARGFWQYDLNPHPLVAGHTYQIQILLDDGIGGTYQNTKLFKVVNV